MTWWLWMLAGAGAQTTMVAGVGFAFRKRIAAKVLERLSAQLLEQATSQLGASLPAMLAGMGQGGAPPLYGAVNPSLLGGVEIYDPTQAQRLPPDGPPAGSAGLHES